MVEYVSPQDGVFNDGYSPNVENLHLELYRLLTIFLANSTYAELRNEAGSEFHWTDRFNQIEDDEITRILLVVAINARVIDDRDKRIFDNALGNCGTLLENGLERPLTLREASNKIIHANKVRADVSENDAKRLHMNPVIYLYGKRQSGIEWKATLDVIQFSKMILACIN